MIPFGTVSVVTWAHAVELELEAEALAIVGKAPPEIDDPSLLQDSFREGKIIPFENDPLVKAAGLRGGETFRTNGRQAYLHKIYMQGGPKAAAPGSKLAYHQIGRARDYWPYPLGVRATNAEAEVIFAGLVPVMAKYGLKNLASIGDADHIEDLDPLNP